MLWGRGMSMDERAQGRSGIVMGGRRDAHAFVDALIDRGVSWEEASRAARTVAWEERKQPYPLTAFASSNRLPRRYPVDAD